MTCKTDITGWSKTPTRRSAASDNSTIREKPIVANDTGVMRDEHQRVDDSPASPFLWGPDIPG
jgi:hypothetical protein